MPFWALMNVLVWPRSNLASITLGTEAAREELDLSATPRLIAKPHLKRLGSSIVAIAGYWRTKTPGNRRCTETGWDWTYNMIPNSRNATHCRTKC
jgi:hypothetical protein